mgnify:CR=1
MGGALLRVNSCSRVMRAGEKSSRENRKTSGRFLWSALKRSSFYNFLSATIHVKIFSTGGKLTYSNIECVSFICLSLTFIGIKLLSDSQIVVQVFPDNLNIGALFSLRT